MFALGKCNCSNGHPLWKEKLNWQISGSGTEREVVSISCEQTPLLILQMFLPRIMEDFRGKQERRSPKFASSLPSESVINIE